MPHMSPRLKMRRGRFGAGGFKPPIVNITSPLNGALIGGSPAQPFTATAADDIQGDISSVIEWFVAGPGSPVGGFGSPSVAVGASVDLEAFLPTPGSPQQSVVVHARATDSGGRVGSDSVTVIV